MKKIAAYILCLCVAGPSYAHAATTLSNAQIAVIASMDLCLLPLMKGEVPDEVAVAKGAAKLPDDMYRHFKNRSIDKAGYMVKPGEVLLLTTTEKMCSIAVRTLDPKDFADHVRKFYTKENRFVETPSQPKADVQHHVEFRRDLGKVDALTLISYSDTPREDGMQGLITTAITNKETK